jgi:hypothetical protein
MSIHLYHRQSEGGAHSMPLDGLVSQWRDITRAVGGFYQATGVIGPESCTPRTLRQFYHNHIGGIVKRYSYGRLMWEGIIYEMRLIENGVEYSITLDPEWYHNRTKVIYTDTDGAQQTLDWSEVTDSSDLYGEMNYILTLGGATSAGATALQQRHLKEYAWPRSRTTGGLAHGDQANRVEDALYITCAGFWATLNWRYDEANATDAASTLITSLVGQSEYVSAGRIESNTLSTYIDAEQYPQRIGDVLEKIIGQGDASGNLWQGGVYADRVLVYEQAPTTVTHTWRDGLLLNTGGHPVAPSLVQPGILVKNAHATVSLSGQTNAWDDPSCIYVDEVEYDADANTARLHLYGQEESILTITEMYANMYERERQEYVERERQRIENEREAREAWANDYQKRQQQWESEHPGENFTGVEDQPWEH